jgi:hypothetical protein
VTFDQVDDPATQRPARPRPADLEELLRRYERFVGHSSGLYAIWSPVLTIYGKEYGLQRPSQSTRWLDLLRASPEWRLVFERGGTYMFRALPPPAATRAG